MTTHVTVNEKYNTRYRGGEPVTLGHYVYHALDGSSHDTGALEAAYATTNNACRLVARLIEKLVDQGVLKLEDIPALLDSQDKLMAAPQPPSTPVSEAQK